MKNQFFLLLLFICFFSCQSDSTETVATTAVSEEKKPVVVKDPKSRIDNLVIAMNAVEDAISVNKTFKLKNATYKIQGTYLENALIKLSSTMESTTSKATNNWYIQNNNPVYSSHYTNDFTCGEKSEHCLAERVYYYQDGNIKEALLRTNKVDTSTSEEGFDGKTLAPYQTNLDSVKLVLAEELNLYKEKIKE